MRQIFAVFLALACVAGGGCKKIYKVERNYLEHFELVAEGPPKVGREKALEALHSWAVANGYTRLVAPADVAAATTWSGHGKPYEEVWRKTLDPKVPKSNFVITVMEDGKPTVIFITLIAERWGEEPDHARQIPMVEKEREEFYKVFNDFPWLEQPKFKKAVPAGPVPAFRVEP